MSWESDLKVIKDKLKKNSLMQDVLDDYNRWNKRPSSDFDEQTITLYDIDLDAGIKMKAGLLKGENNFGVKEYLFPKEWKEPDIKKWLLLNENKIRIRIERIGD